MPDHTDPHAVADDPSGIVQQMPEGGDDALAWQSLHEWTPKEGTWAILWPGHYGPFTACWIRGRWTMCEDIDFKHATIGAEMQLPHLVTEAVPFVDRGGATEADLRAEVERLQALIRRKDEALREAADELDEYYRAEYPSDHPLHQKKRAFLFEANPARAALYPETDGGQDG